MSSFKQSEFAHLKKLCRIHSRPEEEADLRNSLGAILKHMEQLGEVNTDDVAPCSDALGSMLKNRMREDEVKDLLPREKYLANVPEQVGGMVRVPPVLKPS